MKVGEVKVGGRFQATVSGRTCVVRVEEVCVDIYDTPKSLVVGWIAHCTNERTGKRVTKNIRGLRPLVAR